MGSMSGSGASAAAHLIFSPGIRALPYNVGDPGSNPPILCQRGAKGSPCMSLYSHWSRVTGAGSWETRLQSPFVDLGHSCECSCLWDEHCVTAYTEVVLYDNLKHKLTISCLMQSKGEFLL